MGIENKPVLPPEWTNFVETVLKPHGLDKRLNGDTPPLVELFRIRLVVQTAKPPDKQAAENKLKAWREETTKEKPGFFERTDPILQEIFEHTREKPLLVPGQKHRGGFTY